MSLSDCTYEPIIWLEQRRAPERLTRPEMDALKQRAIDQYGATWLHEFGSLLEAEVYHRLGVQMPEVSNG